MFACFTNVMTFPPYVSRLLLTCWTWPRYSVLAVAASFACSHRCVDEDKMPATAEVLYISNSGPRRNLHYWARWSPWLPQLPLPFATTDSWKDAGRLWSGEFGRPNGRGRRVCRKSGEHRHVVILRGHSSYDVGVGVDGRSLAPLSHP